MKTKTKIQNLKSKILTGVLWLIGPSLPSRAYVKHSALRVSRSALLVPEGPPRLRLRKRRRLCVDTPKD